jgi:dipeptidyl aminopeptidase/acylaminoacyl peptidase
MVAEGKADPERLAIMGTSYGGFMSSWVIGHDHRFKTAIVQAPLTNHISFFGTSDIGPFFVRHQLGVEGLATGLETMWDKSPLKYAPNVTCPVLLVCGENDDRCPISQSEEYYTALRDKGVRTEFLRYPGASHGLGSIAPPSHRLHRQKAVVAWLSEHLLDGGASARADTLHGAAVAAAGEGEA